MKFLKLIAMLFLVVLTSMFFFPFEFTFLPGINTKMAMAAVGLVLFALDLAKGRAASLDRSFFLLSFLAALVSLAAFASAVINHTNDYTYASYIVSMWVWMGAAYVVVSAIKWVHGEATVEIVGNYLIAVCVMQCGLAIMIDSLPWFKELVNHLVLGLGFVENDVLEKANRLYGIGCSLDVAGTRFSCVLVIIAFISLKIAGTEKKRWIWLYLISFFVISVVGNIIARTTIVGVGMAMLVWLIGAIAVRQAETRRFLLSRWLAVLITAIIVCTVLYIESPIFKDNFRFGFEGFFSLFETGKWETNSNNILKNMIVFPDNLHTWVVGDGYLENPYRRDINYVGPNFGGYYMATDIGYLRFIFYFGLIGLLLFCAYMVTCANELMKRFPAYSWMFFCILLINLIVWMKVSTDIFVVMAIFLCVPHTEISFNENSQIKHRIA